LDPLLGAGGLLPTYPALGKPVFYAGNIQPQCRVKLHYAEVRLTAINAESNTLAAPDLFNRVRFAMWITGNTYGDSAAVNALIDVVQFPNAAAYQRLLCDKTMPLCSQAFNSSDYNVPQIKFASFRCPVNLTLDCYADSTTSTTWDSRMGNLCFQVISDSGFTPHPQHYVTIRVHYEFI
jgi:hypothetical protein